MEVLSDKRGRLLGKRENEDHLYPAEYQQQIDEVVKALSDEGVTAKDLEMFSCALHILDSLTAARLRPQDSLRFRACRAYVRNGRLEFFLPPVGKNSKRWSVASLEWWSITPRPTGQLVSVTVRRRYYCPWWRRL